MSYFFFSPRSVNFIHGTGAQIRYFLSQYPTEYVFNYGYRDPGYDDDALHLEAFWHQVWPFNTRGRGFLNRNIHRLPFVIWKAHRLTSRGQRLLDALLKTGDDSSHSIVVLHDENCATRFNSIRSILKKPYTVILYDLMHLDEPRVENFPEISSCLSNATATYAISRPLQDAAKSLGSINAKRIGFYRPRNLSILEKRSNTSKTDPFRILVMADAKEAAFLELLNAIEALQNSFLERKMEVHFVGNPRRIPSLCKGLNFKVRFYGFVSPSERDQIAASCDIAYLAGSTESSVKCPLAKYSIPSKIGDFVAFGLPFIGRVSRDSAAYHQINEEMQGFALVATSSGEVRDAILLAARSPELCIKMSQNATLYANRSLYLPNPTTEEIAFNLGIDH